MRAFLRAFVALVSLLVVLAVVAVVSIARRGLSARDEPTAVESFAARATRRFALPAATRALKNPVAVTPEALKEALVHFASHCAVCHANDGSGDTAMGRNLYPRAPDLRGPSTQSLSDGELFRIIEHGVRLTGMPAWGSGTAESERQSWELVHFIRSMPTLTPETIERMAALNPKTPIELREEEEARRFLAGEDAQDGGDPQTPLPSHQH